MNVQKCINLFTPTVLDIPLISVYNLRAENHGELTHKSVDNNHSQIMFQVEEIQTFYFIFGSGIYTIFMQYEQFLLVHFQLIL